MKFRLLLRRLPALVALLAASPGFGAVLKPSDVVFMYEGSRDTYTTYGATVLAWGGTPNPKSLEQAEGVKWFGSVGMVTEFTEYHRRNRDTYQEGLCRDLDGNPVKVPWLTDHQSDGVPYWWCCTRQPRFREYVRRRVVETLRAGAHGLHVDDHLGTSGGLWLGLCFCDRCVAGFQDYLAGLPTAEVERLGIRDPATFDFREVGRRWLAAESPSKDGAPDAPRRRRITEHALWHPWTVYQCRGAAEFMLELRALAAETAGRPVPVGANAGLLWPRHLADYRALDLFTAETDHHAAERRFSDLPLFAYRLAEAMDRPYAATASGGDWAFVKQHRLPGLVRGWIALSYAAGQRLMAPHRQWCYTPEKGTHWYEGPAERFAPLYRFVRENASWFDDYRTHADLLVVVPHRAFLENTQPWFRLADRLAAANLGYQLLLAGDEIVDHPLQRSDFESTRPLLLPVRDRFDPADRALLDEVLPARRTFATTDEALAQVRAAVTVDQEIPVRLLPRRNRHSAVIHLLNRQYDPARDEVIPRHDVRVRVDLAALGLPAEGIGSARWIAPGGEPATLPFVDGHVVVPRLDLWGLLRLDAASEGRVP